MTVSAESRSLEFGSVFARRSPSAVKFQARDCPGKPRLPAGNGAANGRRRGPAVPTRSGQAGRLLVLLLAVEQAGPAGGEGLLHVDVGLLHVATRSEERRVGKEWRDLWRTEAA